MASAPASSFHYTPAAEGCQIGRGPEECGKQAIRRFAPNTEAWSHDARRAAWRTPAEIKDVFRNASFVGRNRVVFNVKGNDYRVVVAIHYAHGIAYIRFVGTHQEYERIDAASV